MHTTFLCSQIAREIPLEQTGVARRTILTIRDEESNTEQAIMEGNVLWVTPSS